LLSLLGLSVALSGCVDRPTQSDDDGGDGSTSAASTTASSMVTTTNDPATGSSTGSAGSTDGADGSSDDAMTSIGFTCISDDDDPWHCAADGGPPGFECDLYDQDCPEGEKCMPWANDGSGVWNTTRCSPIAPMPAATGESCTVEGSGTSGIDSCALGAMCWDVDPSTNVGECVAMCGGNELAPICADPETSCAMHNVGALALCLPSCDPLQLECDFDDVCVPAPRGGWNCVPGVAMPPALSEPCGYGNGCGLGSVCALPEVSVTCEKGAPGCCAALCNLQDGTCPDAGTTCEPWLPRGEAPPQLETIGICSAIPMDPRGDWVDFDTSPLVDAGS